MAWKQHQRLHTVNARSAWDREIPYSMMYPPNMTVDWLDTDTLENAQYEKDIKYSFNEFGFRSDMCYDRKDINVLAIGCSMTVGVGVDQHENWPNQLKKKIEDYSGKEVAMWNLATSGASSDYVARMVCKVFDILKPDAVVVHWPPITRLELPTKNAGKVTQGSIHMPLFPKDLLNEDYLVYNFNRNKELICGKIRHSKTGLYTNPIIETQTQYEVNDGNPFESDTLGRDGMHPGPEWHNNVAEYYFQRLVAHERKGLDIIINRIENSTPDK